MKISEHLRLDTLHQIGLAVADLDAAIDFYRDKLELTLTGRFNPPGLAFFEMASTRLMLGLRGSDTEVSTSTLYFRVDDIDHAYQMLLDRGVVFDQPPQPIHRDESGQFGPAGETEWMAFFRDPSGNLLAIAARK